MKCAEQLGGHLGAAGMKLPAPHHPGPAHPSRAPGWGRRTLLLEQLSLASSQCRWARGGSVQSSLLCKALSSDASPPIWAVAGIFFFKLEASK